MQLQGGNNGVSPSSTTRIVDPDCFWGGGGQNGRLRKPLIERAAKALGSGI